MMKTVSRKDIFKFLELIRSIVEREVDLKEFIDERVEKSDLEIDFQGVSNGFLSEIVYFICGYNIEVNGEVEDLYRCPCCGYKTLTECYDIEEGTGYDICPYCKWEDDGTTDVTSYRSINRGSIEDYWNKMYANFNKYYINKWINK